ncbi:MAG: WD40/YVTN/BNR-like repeat-containing protein [Pyrinomonadaceae bacterium]
MKILNQRRTSLLRQKIVAYLLSGSLAGLCFGTLPPSQPGWRAEPLKAAAGKDLNAVYFADTKRGWVAGDDGLVFRTEDTGRNWTRQSIEAGDDISDIYFRNKEDGYLLAGARIYTTEDGGQAWRESQRFAAAQFGGAQPDLYSVRFTSRKRGWMIGSLSRRDVVVDGLLLATTDGGTSWVRQTSPVREELIHLDFAGEKRGWIVGDRGVILYTPDGGETWQRQRSGTGATLYHVDFDDKERGWAVGERGTILRTINGGATWTRVEVAGLDRTTLLSVKFADESDGWAVGRGGTILRSSDGGLTWVEQEGGTKANLFALFVNKRNCWAAGGDGLVLQYER